MDENPYKSPLVTDPKRRRLRLFHWLLIAIAVLAGLVVAAVLFDFWALRAVR